MPKTGLSSECAAEIQGVRGKMMKMRGEVEAANDRADQVSKDLRVTLEKLNLTEEERNTLQRQSTNLNDQVFLLDGQLKECNDKLSESDFSREQLLNEVRGLNHRINTMDAAEETYRQQLAGERDRSAQAETEASEYKRIVARLQMDNDKLEHDVDMFRSDSLHLTQQLKEAEDRNAELASSYNQITIENRQMQNHKNMHMRHEPRSLNAPPLAQQPSPPQTAQNDQEIQRKDGQLQGYIKDRDEALTTLSKKEAKMSQLENEVYVYQENYRMLSDQLREVQQMNQELKQQANRMGAAGDQLADALEQNRTLDAQLSEAEKRNASWEAKAVEMTAYIEQLEQQLQEQKAAYGELYAQMNKTLKDIESTTTKQTTCDF